MLIASEVANVAPSALKGRRPYKPKDFAGFFEFDKPDQTPQQGGETLTQYFQMMAANKPTPQDK